MDRLIKIETGRTKIQRIAEGRAGQGREGRVNRWEGTGSSSL